MKTAYILSALLAAPLSAFAALQCNDGDHFCGHYLLANGYTDDSLANLMQPYYAPEDGIPDRNLGIFVCGAQSAITYSGGFCVTECLGKNDSGYFCAEDPDDDEDESE